MTLYTFSFPTPVLFGPGASTKIRADFDREGLTRPLIVTDQGVASLPFFEAFCAQFEGLEVRVFSEFGGNPVKSQVLAGAAAAREHNADSVVALGGGCPLDVARAIVLIMHHEGDLFDYEDGKPDAPPVDGEIPYFVTVPTTSGTGSEVGRSAVISDDETHTKKILFSPRLMARRVFADPELTLGLPPGVTATTGLDALTHCIEAYVAKGYHPMADGIAWEGVRLIAQSLERAVKNGREDLDARADMLIAAMMGATAFQKGLGATHSLAHALSTVRDMHHGLANGILLPYVMRYNLEAVPERLARLANAVGLEEATGEAFIEWLFDLQRRVGVPSKLSEAGVEEGDLDRMVEVAFEDPCHPSNPRDCTPESLRAIYVEAL